MVDINGVTATKANSILGQSVVGGTVNSAGHLILTRNNGQTIDAGDFIAIVTGILNSSVNSAVTAQNIPNKIASGIAGTTFGQSGVSGAITPEAFANADQLVNSLWKIDLAGNVSLNVADLPDAPYPNTQFAMRFKQDATGGRTLSLVGFKRSQGVLTLSTAANAIDIVVFMYDGDNWYAGLMGVDFK